MRLKIIIKCSALVSSVTSSIIQNWTAIFAIWRKACFRFASFSERIGSRDSNWNRAEERSLSFRSRKSKWPDPDSRNCLFRYVVKAKSLLNLYIAVLLLARISPIRPYRMLAYGSFSCAACHKNNAFTSFLSPLSPTARWITARGNSKYQSFFASSQQWRRLVEYIFRPCRTCRKIS